eukprot:TRINITY_DN696_c0_g1_i1.p1 TRINITY_DN696_c0_g1~~TRINITY_DN696_c0_g1_i1.p1  ORF type:complete len:114 (-),score=23.85 TRINITY_DN696_c0_g1_i1:505-846(-)
MAYDNSGLTNNSGPTNAKEMAPRNDSSLSLTVRAQDGTDLVFKVKPTTKFKKLFQAYCAKKGLDEASLRFLFEGTRIGEERTPEDLNMEEGDMIDAMVEQIGGGRQHKHRNWQ